MFEVGPEKLLFVLVFAFVLLGPDQLPDVARKLGTGMRYWRSLQDELQSHAQTMLEVPTTPEPGPTTATARDADQTKTQDPGFATGPDSFA